MRDRPARPPRRPAPPLVGVLFALGVALLGPRAGAEDRPNVVLVLIDDQGYYDLGCYGASELETPEIDRLAAEGVRFTDYYAAAPICSPSRAGLLTGCYPRRVGLATWVQRPGSPNGLHPDERTLAELFHDRGYATACIGKWHLGSRSPFLPRDQGFDRFFGLLGNLDPIEVEPFAAEGGVPLLRGAEVVRRPAEPAELVERYTEEATRFLRENRDRPFFLYLAHTMAHVPMGVPERFEGTSGLGLYGDVIQSLDWSVGRLRATLDELGLADRTVIVYASDNGRGPGRGPSQPIRGSKLTTFEGGLRVPCIAWGPGLGVEAGLTCRAPAAAMDWYPTLATLAGVRVPDGIVLDGRDLSPILRGEQTAVSPTRDRALNSDVPLRRSWEPGYEWAALVDRDAYLNAFFYHGSVGELAAVRSGRWKLSLSPPALYDLEADPGERQPVKDPATLRRLRGMAALFQEEMRRDARPDGDRWTDTEPGR